MTLAQQLDVGPPYTWAGRFRRVDLPEDTPLLPGILTIDREDGVQLRLFGTFPDMGVMQEFMPTFKEWTLVGWVEAANSAVTVIQARHVGGRTGSPPATIELHLTASAVLLGDQEIPDPTSDRFDQVEITFDELRTWIRRPRAWPPPGWQNMALVRGSGSPEVIPPTGAAIEYGYLERPTLVADIPSLGRVTLTVRGVARPSLGGAQLAEEGTLRVEVGPPVTLPDVDEVRLPFQRLLELAFDRAVPLRHLRIRREDASAVDFQGRAVDRWLYVLTGREAPRPDPNRLLRPLAIYATPSNFEPLLRTWFELHKEQRRALNVFFGTAYEHDRYVDRDLLMAVRAVEGYHRADVPVSEAEKVSFREQLKQARKLAKEQGLDSRVVAAEHAVEPGLGARIADLLERQQSDTEGTSQEERARRDFAEKIAFLRNGLAHVLERLDEFEIVDMYDHRRALLVLIKLELLRRLGATVEERVAIVNNMRWRTPGGLSAFGAT